MTEGRRRWVWGVAAVTLVGAVHALVVATRYHVGSFDDDASYVLAARALASGAGLTTTLAAGPGYPLVGVYPPGYAALLAPLAMVWHHGFVAFRALSFVAFVAVFPLTWSYLARRRIAPQLGLVVLALLALSPILATYATMVMPEAVFLVVLMGLLVAAGRWRQQGRALTWAGAGTLACGAGLLWLKEAGIGLVIGVAAWLLLRRLWRQAVMAAVIPVALFLPVVAARAAAGVPLIGSRYSGDLAGYHGGLVSRLTHSVPHAAWGYVADAMPRSIVPTGVSPLPLDGPLSGLLAILQWTAAPLVLAGAVVWWRRHRTTDAAVVAVPLYLLETLLYPFTNERRVILVLPVILAWYVVGGVAAVDAAGRLARATGRRTVELGAGVLLPGLAGLVALVALVAQFPRDYLYSVGQHSPSPDGSPYMAFLGRTGRGQDVVETGYLWTTALFGGHRTANGAYVARCDPDGFAGAVGRDRAGYLLTAAVNRPGQVDVPCVLAVASAHPGAIRLYRTERDLASVFELVGPGTSHPDLRDLTAEAAVSASGPIAEPAESPQAGGDAAGRFWTVPATGGSAALTWSWPRPRRVAQVSLGGAAAAAPGVTTSVTMELQTPDGSWRTVAAAPGPVGDHAATPFLTLSLTDPQPAIALRITVGGAGTVAVHDVRAIGPGA